MEVNFFNPRSTIIFICLLQGVIFAALLFWRWRKTGLQSNLWLALLVVFFGSSLITPFIGFANVYDRFQWLTFFPFQVAYAIGVCIYLYVLSLTDANRKFSPRDFLLFIPSAIYIVFRFVLFVQSREFKNWFDDNFYSPFINPLIFVTEFIWSLFFLVLSIRHYKKYRGWLNENFSDTEKLKFDWLRNFLYVYTFVFILGGIFDFTDSFIFKLSYVQYFYFQIVLGLVTYYLAIAGYLRSQAIEPHFNPPARTSGKENKKPRALTNALLTESELERLKNNVRDLMEREKPFLEPQLTLAELSKLLGINTTVLSFVINQGFGKNFNDFINHYRVEEVKRKLRTEGAANNSNLLNIALECGFNSKATFNRAFRKQADVTPKEFLANRE